MKRLVPLLAVALAGCASIIEASSSNSVNPVDETIAIIICGGTVGSTIGGAIGLTFDTQRSGHPLENRREIATAISRGAGPFVSDLAAWLELPDALVPALGDALRAAWPTFAEALSKPLTEKAFEVLIGVSLCRDPKLRYHAWRRFDCVRAAPRDAPADTNMDDPQR